MSSCSIFDIPQEIAELALIFSSPSDVASFAQTCRSARRIVYGNDQHLWRRLYLQQSYDDPRLSLKSSEQADADFCAVDWMTLLQRRWKAMRLLQNLNRSPKDLEHALAELTRIVRFAAPMNPSQPVLQDLIWVGDILKRSDVYALSHRHWNPRAQQQIALLWCLLGWRDEALNPDGRGLQTCRNLARAFVYDLRNYMKKTYWGPYLPSTDRKTVQVDWWHVQNMIVVIQNNLLDLSALWQDTRPPLTLDSVRAYSAPGSQTRDPRDWAGVEGTWRRFVCFMDYRDLFTFNFATDNAYDPTFFDDEEFQEATRLIEITLKITHVKDNGLVPSFPMSPASSASTSRSIRDSASPVPSSASASSSGVSFPPSQGSMSAATPDLPRSEVPMCLSKPDIHFVGRSRGGNGNESRLRGTVQMTTDGNVRWRFYSIYEGVRQWGSEGVQIGNICSAAGIVGSWTSVEHEESDPAGPFWMWKVEDDHPSHLHNN